MSATSFLTAVSVTIIAFAIVSGLGVLCPDGALAAGAGGFETASVSACLLRVF